MSVLGINRKDGMKSDLRFCAGSNPACGDLNVCDDGTSLIVVSAGNKAELFSPVNHFAKTIHHDPHREKGLKCTAIYSQSVF